MPQFRVEFIEQPAGQFVAELYSPEGGKLIGAGGGGFLMFYAEEDKSRLRHAMRQAGLKEVRFRFDFEGTKLLIT